MGPRGDGAERGHCHASVLVSLDLVDHSQHWLLPCPRIWLFCGCSSLSDVCLGSSLVVAWCYSLVVLRSYSQFTVREPLELRKGTQNST